MESLHLASQGTGMAQRSSGIRSSGILCALGALVFLGGATTPPVPAKTAAFVSYCADHLEDCRLAVRGVDNLQKVKQLMNHEHACALPWTTKIGEEGKAVVRAQTITILDWLKSHAAMARPKTDDAILQAMAALWPAECSR